MDRILVKSDVENLVKVIIQQFINFEICICNSKYSITLAIIDFSSMKQKHTKQWYRQIRDLFFLIEESPEVHRLFFLASWVPIVHMHFIPPWSRYKGEGQRAKCICQLGLPLSIRKIIAFPGSLPSAYIDWPEWYCMSAWDVDFFFFFSWTNFCPNPNWGFVSKEKGV